MRGDERFVNVRSTVFGAALVVGVVTGKAYFRRVHSRDENARRYWTIIGCYAVLVLAGLVLPLIGAEQRGNRVVVSGVE